MEPPRAIEVRGLRKSYGSLEAVRGIDLHVSAGEVFALLGPNGAGKTTTVEILEGHRSRSGGEAQVLGHDPGRGERALRRRIGIVLQSTGVEEFLTVREVVALHAGYYPHPRDVDEVIALAGLAEHAGRRVNRLSGGQRRRVDLAVALAGDPELLFLDEPTTGFDPSARRQAWDTIRGLAELGKTIFLTTHFMDEAQHLADRVAVIANGSIVAEGSPSTLRGLHAGATIIRFFLRGDAELPDRFGALLEDGHYTLETDGPTALLNELTGWAMSASVELDGLEVTRPSLEDVYLQLTADPGGRGVNDLALALRQVRYENRAFWRNPAAAFFTFAFPLLFMVIFNVIFSGVGDGSDFRPSDFFTPAIIVFAVITATYTNIAMTVTISRDRGVLKRVRGTPLPAWAFLFGRIAHAVLISILLVVIVAAFGALAYEVRFPWDRLPELLLTLGVAAASFCALGLAVSALMPNADAAPAIVNASILPLLFISNVFIRIEDPPAWMDALAGAFPVRHFADAMQAVYSPISGNAGLRWEDLAVIGAWGVAGVLFSLRFFSWEPRG